jgi:RNA polymerase sigma-70 factor (ECF subfamily)
VSSASEPDFPEITGRSRGNEDDARETTALMALVKAGNREAFDRLVQLLRGRAFHVAHSLVGSREDALELSQEALLKVYRARDTFRDGEPFLPWFHRILRNTCFSFLREEGRLKPHSLSSAPDGEAGDERQGQDWEIADGESPLPSEHMEGAERAELFWKAFRCLRAHDREILALRHFDDRSYQQISEALEIPIGTVMSRLFHARRRLRERLEPLLGEQPLEIPEGRE